MRSGCAAMVTPCSQAIHAAMRDQLFDGIAFSDSVLIYPTLLPGRRQLAAHCCMLSFALEQILAGRSQRFLRGRIATFDLRTLLLDLAPPGAQSDVIEVV